MIRKIDHIGIAVKSIDEAAKLYSKLFGLQVEDIAIIVNRKVKVAIIPAGEVKIWLIESMDPEGAIAKFIEERGEGLHHLAFKVEDIQDALQTVKSKGAVLLDEKPVKGIAKSQMAFLHPKGKEGILLEFFKEG